MIWWIISISHGDLEPDHMPPLQKKNGWTPCVTEIYNFTSSFLFSVETQITTGYGGRAITEECLDAIIVMCLQSVVGKSLANARSSWDIFKNEETLLRRSQEIKMFILSW